ncbi:unnamed protein product, partial [Hapterophycus canaliculatus]
RKCLRGVYKATKVILPRMIWSGLCHLIAWKASYVRVDVCSAFIPSTAPAGLVMSMRWSERNKDEREVVGGRVCVRVAGAMASSCTRGKTGREVQLVDDDNKLIFEGCYCIESH